MKKTNKRRGQPPRNTEASFPISEIAEKSAGYPCISFRHLQPKLNHENLSKEQYKEFLLKWIKRSTIPWDDLHSHRKHGLGFEKIPRNQIKPSIPDFLISDKYMVGRHLQNQSFAGLRINDIFYVLWIESEYNQLYDHGK